MNKPISKMTVKEIEKLYNETKNAIENSNEYTDYKDEMILDEFRKEIAERNLMWVGIELY